MTANSDILAAIDAVVGCQQCGGQLGKSPSDDFCSDSCQAAWHATGVERLVGYREPWDRPQDFPGVGSDVYATSSRSPWLTPIEPLTPEQVEAVTAQMGRRYEGLRAVFEEFGKGLARMGRDLSALGLVPPAAERPGEDPRARALRLRKTRNTGPALPGMDGRRRR